MSVSIWMMGASMSAGDPHADEPQQIAATTITTIEGIDIFEAMRSRLLILPFLVRPKN